MDFVARLRSLATGRGRKAMVVLASLLLVLLIGYTLAAFIWLAVDGVPVNAAPVAGLSADSGITEPRRYTAEQAGQWTLFGDAAAVPVAGDGEAAAPDTNLALQLLGTFSAGDSRLAGAVIAERGKDGELFRVGTPVPGGATLEKVEKDHVLLRRRGQLETLRFDVAPALAGSAPDSGAGRGLDIGGGFRALKERMSKAQDDQRPDDAPRGGLGRYADEIKSNPDGVLAELGLRPAGSGAGYTVGDGSNADLIRNLGLRPGDVVLSVNGKALGNAQADAGMVDEVRASGEARVEVKRGSQTFTVNYPLE